MGPPAGRQIGVALADRGSDRPAIKPDGSAELSSGCWVHRCLLPLGGGFPFGHSHHDRERLPGVVGDPVAFRQRGPAEDRRG